MRPHRFDVAIFFQVGLVIVIVLGCAKEAGLDGNGSRGPLDGSAGKSASGGASAGTGGVFDAAFDIGSWGGSGAGDGALSGCSGDLRDVIDSSGSVVSTCAPDQGCFKGECIAACEAAKKSGSNLGCHFVLAATPFHKPFKPPCLAAFVANAWAKDVTITVTRAQQSFDVSQFGRIAGTGGPESWTPIPKSGLPPLKVGVLFLNQTPGAPFACPLTPAVSALLTLNDGSARGEAFVIETDVPVSVYDIAPYGGAKSFLPSAELLLPTTAWGKNYIAVTPPAEKAPAYHGQGNFWGQVIALESNTTVKVLPTVDLPAGTDVLTAPKNSTTEYKLDQDQFVQWLGPEDLSGTIIEADKPVTFVGGLTYTCLRSKTSTLGGGCDSSHQMIPPINALGSEYVAPPFETRAADLQPESVLYRMIGSVDGTSLSFDPVIPGAPSTLHSAEVADFEASQAFVVKSQDKDHPFYLAQLMPGCRVNGGTRPGDISLPNTCEHCLGDEEFVTLLPSAQFLKRYVFFTDPSYSTTNLVFVRKRTSSGFKDVMLDCVGNVGNWKDIGQSGEYQMTTLDLVRSGAKIGSCDNGYHLTSGEGPIGVTVWGEDCASSYAYPAGGNLGSINEVHVPPVPK